MPADNSANQITAYVSHHAAPRHLLRYTTINVRHPRRRGGHSTAGVFGNVVAHNRLTFNGTLPKSPGAG